MGTIWQFSGGAKPPAKPRKPPAKRPARRTTGTRSRPAQGQQQNEEAKPATEPKPKPARQKTNTYQMELEALVEATAALPPDLRDAVVSVVQGIIDLSKGAWRALHGSGPRGDAPQPRGGPPHEQE